VGLTLKILPVPGNHKKSLLNEQAFLEVSMHTINFTRHWCWYVAFLYRLAEQNEMN